MTTPEGSSTRRTDSPREQLPTSLVEVLRADEWGEKAACRSRARLAGLPSLWHPSNPRRWWGWAAGAATVAGVCWSLAGRGTASSLFYIILVAPGLSTVLVAWTLKGYERRRRPTLNAEKFFESLESTLAEKRVALAVRYALARVGGLREEAVRADENASTFNRLTLARYPLLHEFSYYVSEKLYQINPLALGDFLAERQRRTIADLIAGVQEFMQARV